MFKRFLPSLSASSSNSKLDSPFKVGSTSSSSNRSGCSSEEIFISDIPTIQRRHSFVTPYAESMLEKELNKSSDNADMSIDPFDSSNSLKRSKSLSFNVVKKPSFSSFRKKPLKSVHFDDRAKEPTDILKPPAIASQNSIKNNSPQKSETSTYSDFSGDDNQTESINHKSMEHYRSHENEIQKKYSLFLDDSNCSETEDKDDITEEGDNFEQSHDKESQFQVSEIPKNKQVDKISIENECKKSDLFTEYSEDSKTHGLFESSTNNLKVFENYRPNEQIFKGSINEDEFNLLDTILDSLSFFGERSPSYEGNVEYMKEILRLSELAKDEFKKKEHEITLLDETIAKHHSDEFEKDVILRQSESLMSELTCCAKREAQTISQLELLLQENDSYQSKEIFYEKDQRKLESDLRISELRLKGELNLKQETINLLNNRFKGEEILDGSGSLIGHIETIAEKYDTVNTEKATILEENVLMKKQMESLKDNSDVNDSLSFFKEENIQIKFNIEEIKQKLKNEEKVNHNQKSIIESLAEQLKENECLLSSNRGLLDKLNSKITILEKDKDHLKIQLSNNIADMEEADKQMREELGFRNRMEKDYDELNKKMKGAIIEKNEIARSLDEKIAAKCIEVTEKENQIVDRNNKYTEITKINQKLKEDEKQMQDEINNLIEDRKKMTSDNRKLIEFKCESTKALNILQAYIKRINKNSETMSKELLIILRSNEILSEAFKKFTLACFNALKSVTFEESSEYFTKIYMELFQGTVFSEEQGGLIENVSQFIVRSISDLVTQYSDNEALLEVEVEKRNTNYQKMLARLTKIMEDSIMNANNSQENDRTIRLSEKFSKKHKKNTLHNRGIIYKNPNQ